MFQKAVKTEIQLISASYAKEVEMLRAKLSESNTELQKNELQKSQLQDNLKKAFMRGVCALNFEAMSILTPEGKDKQMYMMEQEMQRQVALDNRAQLETASQFDEGASQVSYNISEATSDIPNNQLQYLNV